MKCRCEPQVVESRTLRIASWGLTITGSLTVSVVMSLTPFQQIARMVPPRAGRRRPGGRTVLLERRHLTGLEQGLRAIQRLDDQGAGDGPCGVAAAAAAGWSSRRIVTAVPSPTGEG